jgi:tetratricopeptide (TPR) repeat protein
MKYPHKRQAYWILGNFYVWYGKYEDAKTVFEKLIDQNISKNPDLLVLAKVYYRLNMYVNVVKVLNKGSILQYNSIENCYLGSSYVELNKYDKAIKFLKRYVGNHNIKDHLIYARLGYAYYMSGKFYHALESYQHAKQLKPSEQRIDDNISLCMEKLNETRQPVL